MPAREGRGIHVELCLVLPIRQPNPLQRLFVVAVERVGDQLTAQKIGLHDARDFRVVPLLNPGMAAVIECAKPPTRMKNDCVGWQGESWKAYQESMPSNCDKSDSGEYTVRHNPAPYYTSLSEYASRDVPYTQLSADLARSTLPAFSFITPNLIDDMHDGTIAQGDAWLARNLPAILNSHEYKAGTTAVFITWDEGSGGFLLEDCDDPGVTDTSCLVPTIVISPSTPTGTTSGTFFDHYSLLATTEQLLGLPKLRSASSATSMTAAFHL